MNLKRTVIAVIAGLIALCSSAQGVISVDSKASTLPDGNVELLLTVSLEPGWYMYSTVPVSGGPLRTDGYLEVGPCPIEQLDIGLPYEPP